MQHTTKEIQKDTDGTDCENEWCDGPDSDTLPCFACFDSDRSYDVRIEE